MLARVKQDYLAGPVIAFSGREYIRAEWREVPDGFEEQAQSHPLLETQPSLDEVRVESAGLPGLGNPEPAVTAVTEESQPAAESPEETKTEESQAELTPTEPPVDDTETTEPKTTRRRSKRAAED